jgi:hypothetical protein
LSVYQKLFDLKSEIAMVTGNKDPIHIMLPPTVLQQIVSREGYYPCITHYRLFTEAGEILLEEKEETEVSGDDSP